MSRWFLHVHDGTVAFLAPEGSELPDLAAAREEASIAARELVADGLRGNENRTDWRIEVADETGASVLVVPFTDAIRECGG